mmetsp:Transcript_24188/g.61504  ORF Transcript_24188/g.61504 Transcript_24188/m.61504 type:complete len:237 (-) Transcript_24188:1796-2506(-)
MRKKLSLLRSVSKAAPARSALGTRPGGHIKIMSAPLLGGAQDLHICLFTQYVRCALACQVHHTVLDLVLVPLRLDPPGGVELLQDVVVLSFSGQNNRVIFIFHGLVRLPLLHLVADDGIVRSGASLTGGVVWWLGRQSKQRNVVVLRRLHPYVVKHLGGQIILLGLSAINRFLQRTSQYQAINQDFLGLPNPPGSFPGLLIDLRVPLWIKQHQSVCTHKVDSDTPNPRRGQHAENI